MSALFEGISSWSIYTLTTMYSQGKKKNNNNNNNNNVEKNRLSKDRISEVNGNSI